MRRRKNLNNLSPYCLKHSFRAICPWTISVFYNIYKSYEYTETFTTKLNSGDTQMSKLQRENWTYFTVDRLTFLLNDYFPTFRKLFRFTPREFNAYFVFTYPSPFVTINSELRKDIFQTRKNFPHKKVSQ